MQFTVFDPKEFIRIRGTSSMPTDIEQYLNVRSAAGGSFSPDGELAFLLDTTGTPPSLVALRTPRAARPTHLLRRADIVRFLLARARGIDLRDGRRRQRAHPTLSPRKRHRNAAHRLGR